jgi:RNA methyltransferase, TrmH family
MPGSADREMRVPTLSKWAEREEPASLHYSYSADCLQDLCLGLAHLAQICSASSMRQMCYTARQRRSGSAFVETDALPTASLVSCPQRGKPNKPLQRERMMTTHAKHALSLDHRVIASANPSLLIDDGNHPAIRSIQRLHTREGREKTRLFYVEGVRFVHQAIQHRVPVETLVICRPLLRHPVAQRILHQQQRKGTVILEVTPQIMESLSLGHDSQGIGAVVHQQWEPLAEIKPANELCWIVLSLLRTPGNLGTMLRTSEAVGGAGIILLGSATDPYDPPTVRATMGALFAQRLVRATLTEFSRWKQRYRCQLIGTSPTAPTDYRSLKYHPPTLLLMGEERQGLTPELQTLCDGMARIPMVGKADSLNVAVAAGVMLYEVFNQRRAR